MEQADFPVPNSPNFDELSTELEILYDMFTYMVPCNTTTLRKMRTLKPPKHGIRFHYAEVLSVKDKLCLVGLLEFFEARPLKEIQPLACKAATVEPYTGPRDKAAMERFVLSKGIIADDEDLKSFAFGHQVRSELGASVMDRLVNSLRRGVSMRSICADDEFARLALIYGMENLTELQNVCDIRSRPKPYIHVLQGPRMEGIVEASRGWEKSCFIRHRMPGDWTLYNPHLHETIVWYLGQNDIIPDADLIASDTPLDMYGKRLMAKRIVFVTSVPFVNNLSREKHERPSITITSHWHHYVQPAGPQKSGNLTRPGDFCIRKLIGTWEMHPWAPKLQNAQELPADTRFMEAMELEFTQPNPHPEALFAEEPEMFF